MSDKSRPGAADFEPCTEICPTCKAPYLKDQPWKRVCLACYLRSKARTAPTVRTKAPAAPIEPDMLRRLIFLAHPDKHADSEASNVATRFLLSLREDRHD